MSKVPKEKISHPPPSGDPSLWEEPHFAGEEHMVAGSSAPDGDLLSPTECVGEPSASPGLSFPFERGGAGCVTPEELSLSQLGRPLRAMGVMNPLNR